MFPKTWAAATLDAALFTQTHLHSSTPASFSLLLRHQLETAVGDATDHKVIPKSGIHLQTGQVASVGGQSRLEFLGPAGELLRIGHHTEFGPTAPNHLAFRRGAFLLHIQEGGPTYALTAPGVHIRIAAHGTFLGEVMPKGGLKLIPLQGEGCFIEHSTTNVHKLHPGHIHFFLPDGDNPPMLQVDLALLVNSCPLLQLFPDTLPSMPAIRRNAIAQARNIKLRSNSFVYDAVAKDRIRFLVPGNKEDGTP